MWHYGKMAELQVGPWTGEPDKIQWVDPATDYDCLIVRGPVGALCGYVGIPFSHKYHGADYCDVDVDVHGGLTFASLCDEEHPEGICHVPAPGRPDNVWWLGFDCSHFMDEMPLSDHRRRQAGIEPPRWPEVVPGRSGYKTVPYVITEVTSLAAQLKELA